MPLKDVRIIGVDELFAKSQGREKYITIVRDLESGAVLYVGDGKGSESLNEFLLRIKHSKAKISTVAMDMSKAYISGVEDNLPNAQKVFDHFHVIKLIDDKLDKIRRRTAKEVDEGQKLSSKIRELIDMAKIIENNLDGIIACWTTNAVSNAGMEGFNNKVRWLIRQAYGFRDKDYFILKIYNLPNTKTEAVI